MAEIFTSNAKKVLPPPTRRGLSRLEAADYIGIGETKFDAMVLDGRMPRPKRIDGRRVWDVRALDAAFEALPGGDVSFQDEADIDPWGEVLK